MQPADFNALWDFNHPDETEKRFRALFATDPGYDDNRLQLLTQIARAQGLQGQFDAAHRTLDLVKTHLDAATVTAAVRYALERGRAFNSGGDVDQARGWFQQAFAQAQAAGLDGYAVDAAHMLAIAATGNDALAWNLKALTLAEQSTDEAARRWFGSLYNNLGWTYYDLNQYDLSLTTFQKAVDWYRAASKPDALHIARYTVAHVLRALRRVDEALIILRQLEPSGDGYVYEELAECLLLTEGQSIARPYFERAYQVLSQDAGLSAREPQRLARLRTIGGVA